MMANQMPSQSHQYQDDRKDPSYYNLRMVHSDFPSESSGIYDMNELPYISQSRTLLVIVCFIMFITAACVYMPLGNIQADYDGKCLLGADLHFEFTRVTYNKTLRGRPQKLRLNPVNTDWGPGFDCDMTTFTPVMLAILSTVIGWSAFTVWPTMMEMGKGGGLMLVYAFLFFLCLGSIVSSSLLLFRGYKKTCDVLELNSHDPTSFKGIISSSRANEPTIPCSQLNTETVQLKSEGESVVVTDVHRAIIIAQVASVVLICLSCLQIIVCMGTFGVIWYHFHFLAMHLYTEEHSLNDDEMDDEWDMHTQNSDYIN